MPHIETPGYATHRMDSGLNMNLLDRFARVFKSNINNVLQKMEDPEKVINQAIEDMQNDLVNIRQSYAQVTATQRGLMKQQEQAQKLADNWYGKAQLALQKGKEDLARDALTHRQSQETMAQRLQEQVDTQSVALDKLYGGMRSLEMRLLENKGKKDQMIARARTARSTQKLNDMLSGITGRTSVDAFTRMEEKVEALETEAEVSAEMTSLDGKLLTGSGSMEKELNLLEGTSEVDNELEKMKRVLGSVEKSVSFQTEYNT